MADLSRWSWRSSDPKDMILQLGKITFSLRALFSEVTCEGSTQTWPSGHHDCHLQTQIWQSFFLFLKFQSSQFVTFTGQVTCCHWRHCHIAHHRKGTFQILLASRGTSSAYQGQPWRQKVQPVHFRVLSTSQSTHRADGSLVDLMISDTTFLLAHCGYASVLPWDLGEEATLCSP